MHPYHLYGSVPPLEAHKKSALINTESLKHNYKLLTSKKPDCLPICVVKADAYSHSAEICVPVLIDAGCRFFAVSCIEEAIAVRKICKSVGSDSEILILGYTEPSQTALLADNNIIQTAVSLDHAQRLSASAMADGHKIRVHLAIDTGMNRIGICANSDIACDNASIEVEKAFSLPGIKVEGMFTHFASSDDKLPDATLPDSITHRQAQRFLSIKSKLEQKGIRLFCHACNSAAAEHFPEYSFDAVRLGIMLYGVYPSDNFDDIGLRPVMSLSTIISHIHKLPAGGSVSYGGTFTAEKDMTIATLPIGYADGFLRKYTGAEVTVATSNGEYKAEIIGRICMDQCMIDVSNIPAQIGDKVTLFGLSPGELRKLASLADTIEYECLCLISARVPRIKK